MYVIITSTQRGSVVAFRTPLSTDEITSRDAHHQRLRRSPRTWTRAAVILPRMTLSLRSTTPALSPRRTPTECATRRVASNCRAAAAGRWRKYSKLAPKLHQREILPRPASFARGARKRRPAPSSPARPSLPRRSLAR